MSIRRFLGLTLPMLLLAAVAGCGAPDIDWTRTVGDLASSACRGSGSCTAVCADGSTLDGRPAAARCRR